MADPNLSREQILDLLGEGPQLIAVMTAGVDARELRAAPADGEWSAADILAHLRACADVWGAAITTILAQDGPTIKAMSPRTWIRSTDYPDLDFQSSLGAYAEQRAALLDVLEPLPPDAWTRTAIVKGAGGTIERSMRWYALGIAAHERAHVKQIKRALVPARAAKPATRTDHASAP